MTDDRYIIAEGMVRSKLEHLNEKEFRNTVLEFLIKNYVSPKFIDFALEETSRKDFESEVFRFKRIVLNTNVWKIKEEARKRFWIYHIDMLRKEVLIFVIATFLQNENHHNLVRFFNDFLSKETKH